MSSRPDFDDPADHTAEETAEDLGPIETRWAQALTILWPAFVAAGVLELIVFAVVDPEALHRWGGEPLAASRNAIYTMAFFVFWGAIAAGSATTQWLFSRAPQE